MATTEEAQDAGQGESHNRDDALIEQTRRREFRCAGCGYGAIAVTAPARCPMCGTTGWEERKFEGRKQ